MTISMDTKTIDTINKFMIKFNLFYHLKAN